MAEDDNNSSPLFTANVSVILIALGSAAFVVTMYHLIALCLCRHHLTNSDEPPNNNNELHLQASSSFMDENSLAELIPSHKYTKKKGDNNDGDVEGGGEATCAVCLGDFEEGEEVRTLPECWHSFHVTCIDMWLLSHPNCPMCRAVAKPSPSPVVMCTVSEAAASGDLALVAVDHRGDNIVAQNALVHSFMLRR